jgi:hypothetical protein
MAIAFDTLAYARRLREAGLSEREAEGHARALAAAMTDSLATKQDFHDLGVRIDSLEKHVDTRLAELEKRVEIRLAEQENRMAIRFEELEKRMGIRFDEQGARFGGQLADLERRLTLRLGAMMVACVGVVSALVRLL